MKKQALLAVLRQKFPQFSKEQLYSRVLCGHVSVAGETLRNPKQLVAVNTELCLSEDKRYVSRGGYKLQKAIEMFGPKGFLATEFGANGQELGQEWLVLDAGASSGGFSDCLLQHGCNKIYAVDSGKNQLDFKLRRDPRVVSFENCKIQDFLRALPESGLQMPDFVVMDISFRSILALVPLALAVCRKCAGVFLCKPQFEWQAFCQANQAVDLETTFDGVMEETMAWQVLAWFCSELEQMGIAIVSQCPSPIRGGNRGNRGNLEFLLYLRQPLVNSY